MYITLKPKMSLCDSGGSPGFCQVLSETETELVFQKPHGMMSAA